MKSGNAKKSANKSIGVANGAVKKTAVSKSHSSRFRGVSYNSNNNKWRAQIWKQSIVRTLSYCKFELEAALVYHKDAVKINHHNRYLVPQTLQKNSFKELCELVQRHAAELTPAALSQAVAASAADAEDADTRSNLQYWAADLANAENTAEITAVMEGLAGALAYYEEALAAAGPEGLPEGPQKPAKKAPAVKKQMPRRESLGSEATDIQAIITHTRPSTRGRRSPRVYNVPYTISSNSEQEYSCYSTEHVSSASSADKLDMLCQIAQQELESGLRLDSESVVRGPTGPRMESVDDAGIDGQLQRLMLEPLPLYVSNGVHHNATPLIFMPPSKPTATVPSYTSTQWPMEHAQRTQQPVTFTGRGHAKLAFAQGEQQMLQSCLQAGPYAAPVASQTGSRTGPLTRPLAGPWGSQVSCAQHSEDSAATGGCNRVPLAHAGNWCNNGRGIDSRALQGVLPQLQALLLAYQQ